VEDVTQQEVRLWEDKSYEKASLKWCVTPPESPSGQANSPAVDQEIPHTLWN